MNMLLAEDTQTRKSEPGPEFDRAANNPYDGSRAQKPPIAVSFCVIGRHDQLRAPARCT
jgi:hypothetical protein